jgi:hypothetical protein
VLVREKKRKLDIQMVKNSKKTRSVVVAAAFGLFLATTAFATTANAATVKNGVSCSKTGAKTTVGKKKYVCGYNPYITSTKRTWMLADCKLSNDLLIQLKDAEENMLIQANIFGYKTLTDLGNALGGQEQKDVNELVKAIADSEATMKNILCKKGK